MIPSIRIWNNKKKKWVKDFSIDSEGFPYEPYHEERLYHPKIWEPSCGSGLIDKNGKEIFEGNIIFVYDKYGKQTARVVFDNGSFGWKTDKVGHCPLGQWDEHHGKPSQYQYEVIGNIYENPELLEKHDK